MATLQDYKNSPNQNVIKGFKNDFSVEETINDNFSKGLIDVETRDKALRQYENLLSKAEGARGGNIIGHTGSGKPIYMNTNKTQHHNNFTKEDHEDAHRLHMQLGNKKSDRADNTQDRERAKELSEERDNHYLAADNHKNISKTLKKSW